VEGMIRLMSSSVGVTGPINIGNPGEFTVRDLADQVMALIPDNAGIEFLPLPQDDPVRRQPDISKARSVLGWEPTVPLSQGLPRTIDYFRSVVVA